MATRDRQPGAERLEVRRDEGRRRRLAPDRQGQVHPGRLARAWTTSSRRPPGARARPPSSPAAPGWRASRRTSPRPGFNMTIAPTPSLGSGDKLPFEAIRGTAGEPFMVPAKAKNVAGGLEYFRTMLSKKGAQDFTKKVASLTVVAGATEGVELPFGLTTVVKALDASGSQRLQLGLQQLLPQAGAQPRRRRVRRVLQRPDRPGGVPRPVPEGRRLDRPGQLDQEVQAGRVTSRPVGADPPPPAAPPGSRSFS